MAINGIVQYVVVVVVFTLKAVPISTQYFLTSVLVQHIYTTYANAFRGHSANYPERVHNIVKKIKRK